MKANPKVEISAMNEEGKWIRISAEAVLDENIKAQEHMLDNYPDLKAMYKAGDGNTEVYYLKNGVAQICSFADGTRQIKF